MRTCLPAKRVSTGLCALFSVYKHKHCFTKNCYLTYIKIVLRYIPVEKLLFLFRKKPNVMTTIPYIIADNKIPYLKGVLEPYARIDYLSPDRIDAQAVRNADILLIRTRTKCNRELLDQSRCRYIATATIGYDHIDARYCRERGIEWVNCPGCNAPSVGQYILAALLAWSKSRHKPLHECTLGVVGVGHVGSIVARYAGLLGMRVLLNDPPREEAEGGDSFTSLDTLCREADIITFHTPLTREGKYPTFHLANDDFFNALEKSPLILNTARGEIVATEALKAALAQKKIAGVVLDCWENEPHIDRELLKKAFIATPHIAGYSADGKSTATRMIVEAVSRWTGIAIPTQAIVPPAPAQPLIDLTGVDTPLQKAVWDTYNPFDDDLRLRKSPETFEMQRGLYPLRREFGAYRITGGKAADLPVLIKLGFCIA